MDQPKYCPNCGKKYKWYEAECPDCRIALVDAPPAGAPSPDTLVVSVFQTAELGLMQLAEIALDQEEIEYFIRDAKGPLAAGGRTYRGDAPEIGYEFLVRTNDADRARALLADLEQEGAPETAPSPAPVAVSTPVPASGSAVDVFDSASGAVIGQATEAQLQWLDEHLERESSTDEDYYIDAMTLEMLQDKKGEPALVDLLRRALGGREGMEIRWERTSDDESDAGRW